MIVDVSKKILIVGLGLLGGSYAKILRRFGFHVSAITLDQSSIDYAINEGIIDEGSCELDKRMIGEADLVIFALYPHVFVEWIEKNLKGKVCIDLDVDRQKIVRFGTPEQIDELVKTEIKTLDSKNGGLMMTFGLYPDIPEKNVTAIMDAFEKYMIR